MWRDFDCVPSAHPAWSQAFHARATYLMWRALGASPRLPRGVNDPLLTNGSGSSRSAHPISAL